MWGIEDIQDDSAPYAPREVDANPVLNAAFDIGDPVTQVRMLKFCEALQNRTDLASSFTLCPMEILKTVGTTLSYPWPMSSSQILRAITTVVTQNPGYRKIYGLQTVTSGGASTQRVAWTNSENAQRVSGS